MKHKAIRRIQENGHQVYKRVRELPRIDQDARRDTEVWEFVLFLRDEANYDDWYQLDRAVGSANLQYVAHRLGTTVEVATRLAKVDGAVLGEVTFARKVRRNYHDRATAGQLVDPDRAMAGQLS